MISPSGKKKKMQAQSYNSEDIMNSDLTEFYQDSSDDNQDPIPKDPTNDIKQKVDDEINKDQQDDKKMTLIDYIYNKLKEYRYPGRRLNEYRSKFVEEKIEADGTKEVTIEIPDKKYPTEDGRIETIEGDDLNNIVDEINKYFGLDFTNAHRSDG
ncbi:MAG: hypothetical protein ACOCRX_07290, partial [Candidatus Woesearchaeota archaeon]